MQKFPGLSTEGPKQKNYFKSSAFLIHIETVIIKDAAWLETRVA